MKITFTSGICIEGTAEEFKILIAEKKELSKPLIPPYVPQPITPIIPQPSRTVPHISPNYTITKVFGYSQHPGVYV